MPHRSHTSNNRRISSCIPGDFDAHLVAAPSDAVLSPSTNTNMPRSRSPYSSSMRTMPNSSRQFIVRRSSAAVKRSCSSSLPPARKATCPVPQSLASVPVIAADARVGVASDRQLRSSSDVCHHSRSRQKEPVSCTRRHTLPADRRARTVPLSQSTSSPLIWLSMPCM